MREGCDYGSRSAGMRPAEWLDRHGVDCSIEVFPSQVTAFCEIDHGVGKSGSESAGAVSVAWSRFCAGTFGWYSGSMPARVQTFVQSHPRLNCLSAFYLPLPSETADLD